MDIIATADSGYTFSHWDDNAITASKIPDGSITATQIGANAVTLAKMASLARGSILIGDSAADVTALSIGTSGYVLKSDGTDIAWAAEQGIADNSITSAKIVNGTIVTADLADDAVTAAKIDGLTATIAELNHTDGVTSAIQTQMDTKASTGKAIAMAIVFG